MNQGSATSIGWCDSDGVTHYGHPDAADRHTFRQYSLVGSDGRRLAILALPIEPLADGPLDNLTIAALIGDRLKEIVE